MQHLEIFVLGVMKFYFVTVLSDQINVMGSCSRFRNDAVYASGHFQYIADVYASGHFQYVN